MIKAGNIKGKKSGLKKQSSPKPRHPRSRTKKISAPFGYFGSKNKIAIQICRKLPPHSCWVEAFCGSAAITLAKKPANIEVINDVDDEIVNFFEQLRSNTSRLTQQISFTPYASEELEKARSSKKKLSKLERARQFLVKSMMAVNGIFGEERGGFSHSDSYVRNGKEARVSRWYNLPDRFIPVVERLRNVRIENRNALVLLKSYIHRPSTLVYLDPPYFGERTNGYNKDANTRKFHSDLLNLANKANCMIFISCYDNDLYNSKLTAKRGWRKKSIKTITKDPSGNSHERTEVIWMNKYFLHAVKTKELPITLTKKEEKDKKVNPIRKSFRL